MTTTHIASAMVPGFERTIGLAHALIDGIAADRFARCPDGHPTMNHPAFLIGHLSIYPDRALHLMGHPDLASPRDAYSELFDPRARNRDDADDSIYPPMDEIVAYFTERHDAIAKVLASVSDEVMTGQMPDPGFRATLPDDGLGRRVPARTPRHVPPGPIEHVAASRGHGPRDAARGVNPRGSESVTAS